MGLKRRHPLSLLALTACALAGCASRDSGVAFHDDLRHYQQVLAETDYADSHTPPQLVNPGTPPPLAMRGPVEMRYWDIPLKEAIQIGLSNATVLRDLGGAVLDSPASLQSLQDPSLVETDPRFGVAAALSAFDAELLLNGIFQKNDRMLNNRFAAGSFQLSQDRHDYEAALRKRTAAGTQYILRQTWDYDSNNANGNFFPTAWDTAVEAEFRQPLLMGSGVEYNRIAGPLGTPGNINGVVIARINTDISLTDLEIGLRDFVSNAENAYWDLYFAYRDLDAKKRARDESLRLWQELAALKGLPGAEEDKVEQAREQYFRFEADVENALSGRLVEGTQADNDTTGGTFRANGGVYVTERRLRWLLGLPLNDDFLIRPSQDPSLAKVVFDWDSVVGECLTRRPELRRQRLTVQRRELELIASRNFLKPRLDAVGTYRWRGFGHNLLDPATADQERFDNAYADLTSGDFQEWQLGFEFSMPLGFRQAYAGVRNSQLALARENAVLHEQERQVLHDLSNALSEMERAYKVAQVNLNRRNAAQVRLKALQETAEEGNITDVDLILDAQQRLAAAESDFFRSVAEYALAVKNVHVEKGTWKSYHEVFLAEDLTCGPGPSYESLPAPAVAPGATPANRVTDDLTPPAGHAPALEPQPALPPNAGFPPQIQQQLEQPRLQQPELSPPPPAAPPAPSVPMNPVPLRRVPPADGQIQPGGVFQPEGNQPGFGSELHRSEPVQLPPPPDQPLLSDPLPDAPPPPPVSGAARPPSESPPPAPFEAPSGMLPGGGASRLG